MHPQGTHRIQFFPSIINAYNLSDKMVFFWIKLRKSVAFGLIYEKKICKHATATYKNRTYPKLLDVEFQLFFSVFVKICSLT